MKMITLYSTPVCPRCKRLAAWLSEQGYQFDVLDLTNPVILTELRIGGCFSLEAPILQIGEIYHPAGWLYQGEVLQTGRLREVLG